MKTSWRVALGYFFAPIVLALVLRWTLIEPYVIPSGSMLPNLLVHDHILVNKLAHGLRFPFSESWLVYWSRPQRGEIVVFKYPRSKDTFFVKRVVGIAGDTIEVRAGQLIINGNPIDRNSVEPNQIPFEGEQFDYFWEELEGVRFMSRSYKSLSSIDFGPEKVPEGHFMVVGDNRDQSSDSRIWGFVPYSLLMGRASLIWLSCEKTLPSAQFLCDPSTIRWSRLFTSVNGR